MAKINIEAKFPCGYEVKMEGNAILRSIEMDSVDLSQCPLHGKDCPRKERTKEDSH